MTKLLRQARNKAYRFLDRGIVVPRPEDFPTDREEFLALLDRQGINDEEDRRAYLLLFLNLAVVLYLEWNNTWASRNGPRDLDELIQQYDSAIDKQRLDYLKLAEQLRQGKITVDEWERQMKGAIEDSHMTAALLIFGPLFLQIPQVQQTINGMIARELAFLARLANGIRAGTIRLDGQFKRRAGMYISAGRETLWELARMWASVGGYTMEENVLGAAEHCEGCLAETARGSVPIGSLIPIGERDCLTSCRCYIRFS